MAAVFKKRAAAKFNESNQALSFLSPPAKRFKFKKEENELNFSSFTGKVKKEIIHVDTDLKLKETGLDVHLGSAYHELEGLAVMIPSICHGGSIDLIINTILDHLENHENKADEFIIKASKALYALLCHPLCNSPLHLNRILNLINTASSSSTKTYLLKLLHAVLSTNHNHHTVCIKCFSCILKSLESTSHAVKSECLRMIGRFAPSDLKPSHLSGHSSFENSLVGVISNHMFDDDWRVRLVALQSLVHWHERDLEVDWRIWHKVVLLLDDDFEAIRLVVAKVIWLIATKNPDVAIPDATSDPPTSRLLDSCFKLLCDVMNDSSSAVRCQAVKLLGAMNGVDSMLLQQAFDKKPLSKNRTAAPRGDYLFQKSEWVMEDLSAMPGSACGAFVHGIEDEVSAVRLASIDSICELSCKSQLHECTSISNNSVNFMFDAANDDMGVVRLNSITCLTKINKVLSSSSLNTHYLTSEQLDNVLALLKDYYKEMRHCTHNLLLTCQPCNKQHLHTLISALLNNLCKYPQDKQSIWRVMRSLGSRQASLLVTLYPALLNLHSFLDTKERPIDDPSYISILILISNSLSQHATNISLLPSFIHPHIVHLSNLYPLYIPSDWNKYMANTTSTEVSLKPSSYRNVAYQSTMLQAVLGRLDDVSKLGDITFSTDLITIVAKELKRLSSTIEHLKHTCIFLHSYLLLLVPLLHMIWTELKVCKRKNSSVTKWLKVKKKTSCNPFIRKMHDKLCAMEVLYVGLTNQQKINLALMKLTLHYLSLHSDDGNFCKNDFLTNKIHCFDGHEDWSCNNQEVKSLFEKIEKFSSSTSKTGVQEKQLVSRLKSSTVREEVLQACLDYFLSLQALSNFNNTLDIMSATIVDPASSDFSHTFCQGYTFSLPLLLKLFNVPDPCRLLVMMTYADGHVVKLRPPLHHYSCRGAHQRLSSTLYLSNYSSSEPTTVELRIAYVPDADVLANIHDTPTSITFESTHHYISDVTTIVIQPSMVKDSFI